MGKQIKCYGCGALVNDIAGQPHDYFGTTQGCWNIYGEILAKEYGEYGYPELTHRLTVDTYAIQHPGQPSRKSIQSVNIHLISLFYIFKRDFNGKEATQKMSQILSKEPVFEWLVPPIPNGKLTVNDVVQAVDKFDHEKRVKDWSENVWDCWYSIHGDKIEKLIIE